LVASSKKAALNKREGRDNENLKGMMDHGGRQALRDENDE
jgi:hypothetical protein